jgi:hypothetical protein
MRKVGKVPKRCGFRNNLLSCSKVPGTETLSGSRHRPPWIYPCCRNIDRTEHGLAICAPLKLPQANANRTISLLGPQLRSTSYKELPDQPATENRHLSSSGHGFPAQSNVRQNRIGLLAQTHLDEAIGPFSYASWGIRACHYMPHGDQVGRFLVIRQGFPPCLLLTFCKPAFFIYPLQPPQN